MQISETNVGDRCLLLTMPRDFAKDLREANRRVPIPGEIGVVIDIEPAGFVVPHDSVYVRILADELWLPAFLFRRLSDGELLGEQSVSASV